MGHEGGAVVSFGEFRVTPNAPARRTREANRRFTAAERCVREADMAARAHLAALREGDTELADATLKRFVVLSQRIRSGGRN